MSPDRKAPANVPQDQLKNMRQQDVDRLYLLDGAVKFAQHRMGMLRNRALAVGHVGPGLVKTEIGDTT